MDRVEDQLTETDGSPALVGVHYQLHCYVCGAGCTKPSPFEGWVTFTQIMRNRPDGCRFAIAQLVPLLHNNNPDPSTPLFITTEPAGPFVAFDLYTPRSVRANGFIPAPPPLWTSESVDGLVMKAMALYGRE